MNNKPQVVDPEPTPPKRVSWAGKAADALERSLAIIAGASFVVISALTVLQVITRYLLAAPPSWTGELAQFIFVWLAWLSSAIVFRHGQHITIDAIVGLIPYKLKRIHELFVQLCCLGVLVFFVWYSFEMLEFTTTISAALSIDMRFVYVSSLVGSLCMLAFALLDGIEKYYQKEHDYAQ